MEIAGMIQPVERRHTSSTSAISIQPTTMSIGSGKM